MQTVVITLTDGRTGKFVGPALLSEEDIEGGQVKVQGPIEFTKPRPLPPGAVFGEIPNG